MASGFYENIFTKNVNISRSCRPILVKSCQIRFKVYSFRFWKRELPENFSRKDWTRSRFGTWRVFLGNRSLDRRFSITLRLYECHVVVFGIIDVEGVREWRRGKGYYSSRRFSVSTCHPRGNQVDGWPCAASVLLLLLIQKYINVRVTSSNAPRLLKRASCEVILFILASNYK